MGENVVKTDHKVQIETTTEIELNLLPHQINRTKAVPTYLKMFLIIRPRKEQGHLLVPACSKVQKSHVTNTNTKTKYRNKYKHVARC